MKIFAMNDCDWVIAETAEQAKEWYAKEMGGTDEEDNNPEELSDSDLDRLKFFVEYPKKDGKKISFREQFKIMVEDPKMKIPNLFASTEY